MTAISSITELLSLSNSQYRVYDLGRKIEKLSKEVFNKIEQCQLPHPSPIQGHAHIAIAFWQKQSVQPYIWFIKLPLDERGLLNLGARNHFIAIIVEALGGDLSADPTEKQQQLLQSNPYLFTPSQYKLAMLNSLLKAELKQQASEHYQKFRYYLKQQNWANWQEVGVQGITDFTARLNENKNTELLINALNHLPFEVLSPLCGALEHCLLPLPLVEKILKMINQIAPEGADKQQMLLRSLASSCSHPFVDQHIASLLEQETLSDNLLITLTGRCWQAINSSERAMLLLEHLVAQDEELFPAIFKDLVAIPSVRPLLFQCMRAPERSQALSKAIGQLFNPQS
ncbi:hypothetical protein tinsulaeT_02560 [Thalassotalea insulae]|uniref:DUF3549 family protein n=1 Tax=Thalassotalea insulae TaxID=2056778 RepID=A0ABQ6GM21_9GAMM|nr:DUF3549 family protein [Thalassotalea insulae]GLX76916.1 hypothetical protein tinsulaeT_02560 [Thalassotalea insulae]